jgi:hypothetical protein
MAASIQPVPTYSVRRLTEEDAKSIPTLSECVNGASYPHHEVYDPDELLRLNREGRLLSVVALSSDGAVVGHFGLERYDLGPIAETGEAMVLPEHRHHHVMEQMRELLEVEAAAAGLVGLSCQAVAQHVFSQLMDDRYGERPVGILFGFASAESMNMQAETQQRLSAMLDFKYLRPMEDGVAYVPAHHQPMVRTIYAALARNPELRIGDVSLPQGGSIAASISVWGTGEIDIVEAGQDSVRQVLDVVREMKEQSQVPVFYVRVPVGQPSGPSLCVKLEQQGFFFSGLVPGGTPEQDQLQLQRLDVPFSFDAIRVENPVARTIVEYAVAAHDRAPQSQS